MRGITTDTTKYCYVVAVFDAKTAERVVDLLRQPPVSDKYEAIKSRLTITFCLSRQERAKRPLAVAGDTLGDRKPTQLMDEMLSLLGSDGIYREIAKTF